MPTTPWWAVRSPRSPGPTRATRRRTSRPTWPSTDRPATASVEESAEYAAVKAVDGSQATWWSAAEGPPQWIEIDLEEDRVVGRVEVLIGDVSPPGTLVGEVTVDAAHGYVVVFDFEPVPGVRVVRVETTAVDGWVILHEIEVYAA